MLLLQALNALRPPEGLVDPYANLNFVKDPTRLHIMLAFKRFVLFLRFVDGFWPGSQSPRCLPSLIKSILWRGQMHYTVFVTWDLLLCGGGTR